METNKSVHIDGHPIVSRLTEIRLLRAHERLVCRACSEYSCWGCWWRWGWRDGFEDCVWYPKFCSDSAFKPMGPDQEVELDSTDEGGQVFISKMLVLVCTYVRVCVYVCACITALSCVKIYSSDRSKCVFPWAKNEIPVVWRWIKTRKKLAPRKQITFLESSCLTHRVVGNFRSSEQNDYLRKRDKVINWWLENYNKSISILNPLNSSTPKIPDQATCRHKL